MTTPVTPRVSSILQELEEKSRQMTFQDYGPLRSVVTTPMLTSYNVGLDARLCSCRRWPATGIPCAHGLVDRGERVVREANCTGYFCMENFNLSIQVVFHTNSRYISTYRVRQRHLVKSPRQRRQARRLKDRHIRSTGEGKLMNCERCTGYDHKRRTFKEPT